MAADKTVLVEFQGHSRIVSFKESQEEVAVVQAAVEETFGDVFSSPPTPFFLQLLNKDWNKYVDLRCGQSIPDRSLLRVMLKEVQPSVVTTSDLLISDVLIVTTAVATPVATSVVTESSSIHKPTSVSNPGVQLKLKIDESGLGLMKETSSSEESDNGMEKEDIKREATFYKKESLSSYHVRVNEASQAICLRRPSMLRKRGDLLILAKQQVHESGYNYRKGRSRSKSYGSVDESNQPKRIKTTIDERFERMKSIRGEVKDLNERISFKRKRLDAAEAVKNYKLCDQLSEEVAEIKKRVRLLEVELNLLQKKEKKSQRYYQRKRESDSDSSSSRRSRSSSVASRMGDSSPPFDPPVKKASFRFASPPTVSVSTPPTSVSISSSSDPVQIVSCDQENDIVLDDRATQSQETMRGQPTSAPSNVQQSPELQGDIVLGDDRATPHKLDQCGQSAPASSNVQQTPEPTDLPEPHEEITIDSDQSF